MLGELAEQGAAEDRHVAGGGLLALVGQAVRIDEAAFAHAEALGSRVHHVGEAVDRAADALGDGHGNVIGRLDHDDLEGVVERDLDAGREAHLGRRHRLRELRRR